MERTIGTVCGGCLGLGISLLGHGFGQDSDMLFTGTEVSFAYFLEHLCNLIAEEDAFHRSAHLKVELHPQRDVLFTRKSLSGCRAKYPLFVMVNFFTGK